MSNEESSPDVKQRSNSSSSKVATMTASDQNSNNGPSASFSTPSTPPQLTSPISSSSSSSSSSQSSSIHQHVPTPTTTPTTTTTTTAHPHSNLSIAFQNASVALDAAILDVSLLDRANDLRTKMLEEEAEAMTPPPTTSMATSMAAMMTTTAMEDMIRFDDYNDDDIDDDDDDVSEEEEEEDIPLVVPPSKQSYYRRQIIHEDDEESEDESEDESREILFNSSGHGSIDGEELSSTESQTAAAPTTTTTTTTPTTTTNQSKRRSTKENLYQTFSTLDLNKDSITTVTAATTAIGKENNCNRTPFANAGNTTPVDNIINNNNNKNHDNNNDNDKNNGADCQLAGTNTHSPEEPMCLLDGDSEEEDHGIVFLSSKSKYRRCIINDSDDDDSDGDGDDGDGDVSNNEDIDNHHVVVDNDNDLSIDSQHDDDDDDVVPGICTFSKSASNEADATILSSARKEEGSLMDHLDGGLSGLTLHDDDDVDVHDVDVHDDDDASTNSGDEELEVEAFDCPKNEVSFQGSIDDVSTASSREKDDDASFGGNDNEESAPEELYNTKNRDSRAEAPEEDEDDDDEESVVCFDGCWTNNNLEDNNNNNQSSSNNNSNDLHLAGDPSVKWPPIRLPLPLYKKLFPHQRIGVQWMASLHRNAIKGGILADDMGMGKTMQTLAYLGSLMRSQTISNAIIICPKSVVRSWEREANIILVNSCVSRATVTAITSDMGKERRRQLFTDAFCSHPKYPHLAITTYGMVSSHITDLTRMGEAFPEHQWCYVVLDEGHTIKNQNTKISKDVRILCRNKKTRRLLLTGTPVQNNLRELYSLFDWATSGKLLGSLKTFLNKYGIPIEDGRQKNASEWTVKKAADVNQQLQKVIQPYFLQRMKKTEFEDRLPSKKELVVFTHLSNTQREMYENFLKGGMISSVLSGETASPLAAIMWLKKLCGHPSLMKESRDKYENCEVAKLIEDSTKLQVLLSLVQRLKRSGHRALIFSQSTKILDIIQEVFEDCSISHLRIDGSSAEKKRQTAVDTFNKSISKIDVMLLSTKAAGVGLTLTGANRAIIYDPSWNPAEDAQAVDRCYRIGQTRNVTVYRFIAAGTVEEKMYEKQVHKDGIRRVLLTSGGSSTARYFDQSELSELFKLAPAGECAMLNKFTENSSNNIAGSSGKPSILSKHPQVVGVASHDLLYSNMHIDLTAEEPFSRQKSQQKLVMSEELNFEDLTMDDSPVKKKYSEQALKPLGDGMNRTRQKREDAKAKRELESNNTKRNTSGNNMFREVDGLLHDGRHDEAMAALLYLVEKKNNPLEGETKLAVHRKISVIAHSIGWL